MTDAAHNPDDYCYRHPDRLSFVLCERCGRTICLECQNHVNGKVLCPDDATSAQVIMMPVNPKPKRQRRVRRSIVPAALDGQPVATYSILALGLLLFLADAIVRGVIMPYLWLLPAGYSSMDVLHQPWTIVTSMISNSGILTLIFGGYSIFVLGRWMELQLGRSKLMTLYIGGGIGASLLAFLLDGGVTSWFAASFGIAGAAVVLARRLGVRPLILYISCGISLIFALLFGGWQAVIGGGLAGAGIGWMYFSDDDPKRARQICIALIATGVVVLALAVLRALLIPG